MPFNSRDDVSVGLFIKDFNQSHGFKAKNGLIIGQFIYFNFFSMWPFLVMCGTMGYLFHVWGGVGVGLFFL